MTRQVITIAKIVVLLPINLCLLAAGFFCFGVAWKIAEKGFNSILWRPAFLMVGICVSILALDISAFARDEWIRRSQINRAFVIIGLILGILIATLIMTTEGSDGLFRQPGLWLAIYFLPVAFALHGLKRLLIKPKANNAIEADA